MLEKLRIAFNRNVTMADHPDLLARVYGDRSGFIVEDPLPYSIFPPDTTYLTFKDWNAFTHRIANVLANKLGVRRGDRVAIIPMNGVEVPATIMAVMKIGAIAVPLNYMLRGNEIKYIVEDSGARVLMTDPEVFTKNIKDRSLLPTVEKWVMAGISGEAPEGFESLDLLLTEVPDHFPPVGVGMDDVVGIFYTSGTTGFPKGAMVTSRGLLSTQKRAAVILPIGKKDFGILALPLAHMFGFAISIMGSCAGVGGCVVRRFDPYKVLSLIEKHHATHFVGVPAMYSFLLACNPERHDLTSLRMLGSSADAMPPEHIRRLQELASRPGFMGRTKKPLFAEAYGMVELTGLAALRPAFRWLHWPDGCVGVPVFPVRARVADASGKKLKAGEAGELLVKGPGVTKGYWNNPAATRSAMVNGWFRTGDVAKKDRWGRIFFIDRVKDVIKCGGYSVFSVEVEEEILQHPDVEEAAVIAVPHRAMGEVPLAVVCVAEESALTEAELIGWCAENIASYKAPRHVRIVPWEEMPYGMTLKIMKRELRDRFVDEFLARMGPDT
jgi:acyl-CoA synthetase (AMP-forming)/AMP-acid ligase II